MNDSDSTIWLLPAELIIHIFCFLEEHKRVKYARICRKWYYWCQNKWPNLIGAPINTVAAHGSTKLVEKLINKNASNSYLLLSGISDGGNVELFKSMMHSVKNLMVNAFIVSASTKNSAVIDKFYGLWLCYKHDCVCKAAQQGNLEAIKFFGEEMEAENLVATSFTKAFCEAAAYGQKTIMEYIFNKFNISGVDIYSAFSRAAFNNHKQIVNYLYDISPQQISGAITGAAESGNLEYLKYLFQTYITGKSDISHDNTAYAMCKRETLNLAILNGHIQVVDFLLKTEWYNNPQCIEHILTTSARNGQESILNHFMTNYHFYEKSLKRAFNSAIGGGHLNIVKLLIERVVTYDHYEALTHAIIGGHLEIVKYFIKKNPPITYNWIFIVALKYGNIHIGKYIFETYHIDVKQFDSNDKFDLNDELANNAVRGNIDGMKLIMRVQTLNYLDWQTALLEAIKCGEEKMVKFIISQQIPRDKFIPDVIIRTAEDSITKKGHRISTYVKKFFNSNK